MLDYLQQDSVLAAMPRDCEGALNHIEEKYGTVVSYLLSCGLTEEEIQKIRMNMLVKDVEIPRTTPTFSDRTPLYPTRDCDPEHVETVDSAYALLSEFRPDYARGPTDTPLLRQSSSVPNLRFDVPENSGD